MREDSFYIRGRRYVDRNGELGRLAGLFRGNHGSEGDAEVRDGIVAAYAKEVDRLIATGKWDYAPNFDEMLPDEYMPASFNEYWRSDKPNQVEEEPSIWTEINNLLRTLDDLEVVKLVREHYAKYGNSAPPVVLQRYMDKLQKRWDEANAEATD